MPTGKTGFQLPGSMVPVETTDHEQAHSCSSSWGIFTPAKLNLYLEVLGRRADGFHALETLMVPVRIYDQLRWQDSESGKLSLRVSSLATSSQRQDQLLGTNDNNLVLRAARLLATTAGIAPRGQFGLVKRIPIQAGMGGGSSDAAAALTLANQAWGLNYPQEQLLSLAAELGSDVPFFLDGCSHHFQSCRAAVCRGRGELIEPIRHLSKLHFVILKPPAGLSTAEVFGLVRPCDVTGKASAVSSQAVPTQALSSHNRLSQLIESLQSGNLAAAGLLMRNRLESAAVKIAPWLVQLRKIFSNLGCYGHFLTGSGSAYVGLMRSGAHARHTAHRLSSMDLGSDMKSSSVFVTSTC